MEDVVLTARTTNHNSDGIITRGNVPLIMVSRNVSCDVNPIPTLIAT